VANNILCSSKSSSSVSVFRRILLFKRLQAVCYLQLLYGFDVLCRMTSLPAPCLIGALLSLSRRASTVTHPARVNNNRATCKRKATSFRSLLASSSSLISSRNLGACFLVVIISLPPRPRSKHHHSVYQFHSICCTAIDAQVHCIRHSLPTKVLSALRPLELFSIHPRHLFPLPPRHLFSLQPHTLPHFLHCHISER
jgi:hypothetical protein